MTEPVVLGPDMLIVMAILAVAVYLFAFEVFRVDVAGIVVMVALGLSGIVSHEKLFDGFASNAVISIIAVMILGAGLEKTGLVGRIAGTILKFGGSTEKRVIPIVSGTVGIISGFLQNVGATALFLPVVSRISMRTGIPLSRLVMPMGFCAILGGTLTMVGSSPLILLNDLIATSNRSLPASVPQMPTLGMFAVTPIGIALVVTGVVYFILAGKRVLPSVRGTSPEPGVTSRHLERVYGIRADIFEARLPLDSPLAGKMIMEAEAQPNAPYIVGILDGTQLNLEPPGDDVIPVGAVLALMGSEDSVREFCRRNRLQRRRELEGFIEILSPSRSGVSEIVLPPGSSLIRKTILEIEFRKNYGTSLLAIYRGEDIIRAGLREVPLRAGDTLVVHSTWADLQALASDRNFVVVTDFPRQEEARTHKLRPALFFFALALVLVVFTDMRLSLALLTGAVGMVLAGVLSMDEAYKAVSWQTVFLLASLIPLGSAMEQTGTAAWIAQKTLQLLDGVPIWALQAIVAVLATGFTLVMSNIGATVVLVPLAVNMAVDVGASPLLFALTVAVATSNSFILPTHQVNVLVLSAGRYRVADFVRAGSTMTLLFLAVSLGMLNLLF